MKKTRTTGEMPILQYMRLPDGYADVFICVPTGEEVEEGFEYFVNEFRTNKVSEEQIASDPMKYLDYEEHEETLEEKVKRLESKIEELKSFANDFGKTELVGDGSAEQPFEWEPYIELIPNAYYTFNDVRYVWMGSHVDHDGTIPPVDDGGFWAEF